MKRASWIVVLTWAAYIPLTFVVLPGLLAQQPQGAPGTKVEPTEVQRLKLENAQKSAIIYQQQSQALHMQAAQADKDAQASLVTLQKLAADVKAENKWGDDVSFEPNQLTFTKADKPVTPHTDPAAPLAPHAKKP